MVLFSVFTNSVLIKILGFSLVAIVYSYLKSSRSLDIEKENKSLEEVIDIIRSKKHSCESIFLDEYKFYISDKFHPFFETPQPEQILEVRLFSDKLEFSHCGSSASIDFESILSCSYSLQTSGRYDSVQHIFINMAFKEDKIVSLSEGNVSENLRSLMKTWKVRSHGRKVTGSSGIQFEKRFIEALKKYVAN